MKTKEGSDGGAEVLDLKRRAGTACLPGSCPAFSLASSLGGWLNDECSPPRTEVCTAANGRAACGRVPLRARHSSRSGQGVHRAASSSEFSRGVLAAVALSSPRSVWQRMQPAVFFVNCVWGAKPEMAPLADRIAIPLAV